MFLLYTYSVFFFFFFFFFFNDTATTEIYTLSLHDALPIPAFGVPPPVLLRLCGASGPNPRSEEHTSELQSRGHLVCRLLLEKKKKHIKASIKHACTSSPNGRTDSTPKLGPGSLISGTEKILQHFSDGCFPEVHWQRPIWQNSIPVFSLRIWTGRPFLFCSGSISRNSSISIVGMYGLLRKGFRRRQSLRPAAMIRSHPVLQ